MSRRRTFRGSEWLSLSRTETSRTDLTRRDDSILFLGREPLAPIRDSDRPLRTVAAAIDGVHLAGPKRLREPALTRVLHVVAARPNYMKIAPVWRGLQRYDVVQTVVHTGQHYDANLNADFFGELALPAPDVQLEVGSGSHGAQTAKALAALEEAFERLEPDLVVVPGDVNSTLAAALAGQNATFRSVTSNPGCAATIVRCPKNSIAG